MKPCKHHVEGSQIRVPSADREPVPAAECKFLGLSVWFTPFRPKLKIGLSPRPSWRNMEVNRRTKVRLGIASSCVISLHFREFLPCFVPFPVWRGFRVELWTRGRMLPGTDNECNVSFSLYSREESLATACRPDSSKYLLGKWLGNYHFSGQRLIVGCEMWFFRIVSWNFIISWAIGQEVSFDEDSQSDDGWFM